VKMQTTTLVCTSGTSTTQHLRQSQVWKRLKNAAVNCQRQTVSRIADEAITDAFRWYGVALYIKQTRTPSMSITDYMYMSLLSSRTSPCYRTMLIDYHGPKIQPVTSQSFNISRTVPGLHTTRDDTELRNCLSRVSRPDSHHTNGWYSSPPPPHHKVSAQLQTPPVRRYASERLSVCPTAAKLSSRQHRHSLT